MGLDAVPGPREKAWEFLVQGLDSRRSTHNHMVVDQLSLTLSAIADPTRRSILRRLVTGPATVGDLASPFHITQQAVSKHLACLERASLIEKRRDGRVHLCTLDARPLREVADWTAEYRRFWQDSFERLDAVLDELKAKDTPHDPQD